MKRTSFPYGLRNYGLLIRLFGAMPRIRTLPSIVTCITPFWTVVFNHINVFGNTNIEFISTSGTKYPSEADDKFRILEVEL
ncbi:hypothetical protein H8356DRAFT_1343050 [Neocallimastix lanati (nom. inval.)]|nr:hypothetical protein H8356DRAFT_1343050 [Neocallimastix sp. JGI-2020a]